MFTFLTAHLPAAVLGPDSDSGTVRSEVGFLHRLRGQGDKQTVWRNSQETSFPDEPVEV